MYNLNTQSVYSEPVIELCLFIKYKHFSIYFEVLWPLLKAIATLCTQHDKLKRISWITN